ncbi:hypothetical protein CR513_56308, partial [Mucuna pruriens]
MQLQTLRPGTEKGSSKNRKQQVDAKLGRVLQDKSGGRTRGVSARIPGRQESPTNVECRLLTHDMSLH